MPPGKPDLIEPQDASTLAGLFRARVERAPDAIAYRWYDAERDAWTEATWRDMGARVARWQAALRREGFRRGDRVALMLPNGIEWVCFDLAALGLGLVVVPIFANDRPDNAAYIIRQTDACLLLVGDGEGTDELCEILAPFSGLRIVVRGGRGACGGHWVPLREWLPDSADAEPEIVDAQPDEIATIVFTSGTVGRSKGVLLSHRNILWNAWASNCAESVYPDDLFLSFLPLSHMLERTVGYYLPMMAGSTVAFARSVAQLAEDLPVIRPTVLISVPRIYERVHARLHAQLAERPAFARKLFAGTVAIGWARFEHAQGRGGWKPSFLLWPVLRRLVAAKVMARLGGRIRIAVCGGAPLSTEVARVFIGLGLPILQGYGMTELSPAVSGNALADNDPSSVGRLLRDVRARIGKDGELLVRSPGMMGGYLNDPRATADTIDAEGWLHTGDKADLREGRLYITGRLKDIIVLSNGEKVPPEDMEMAIARDPLFEQVMVVGEGRPYLTALAVLNEGHWNELAKRHGLDPTDPKSLAHGRVLDEACRRIGAMMREFPGYAQVRRCALTLEPWSIENGLLTPTLKQRRARIVEKLGAEIARLYAGH